MYPNQGNQDGLGLSGLDPLLIRQQHLLIMGIIFLLFTFYFLRLIG